MIDSTDEKVIARALTYCQGKAIINSINLEDGEERFEKVVPLARRFGAALVVGCIDETGMAVTRERKLEVAERSHELLTGKYGVPAEDLYFDPLVFPCASGDEQYVGSAVETIEGVRLIKQRFPRCKTVLGISNVSLRSADRRTRGAELGLPLPLHPGRPGHGAGQLREARALPLAPRGGAAARPRTCSSTAARTRSPPSPRTSASASRQRARRRARCRSRSGCRATSSRAPATGCSPDLDAGAARRGSRSRSSTAR